VTADASGNKHGELRYQPYGSVRYTWGATPTDLRFTGQRLEQNVALIDYGARFYKPWIGRFIQPDTIVPDQRNPQSLNRYAYVLNNPLKYTDPSGHTACYGTNQFISQATGDGGISQANCWALQAAMVGASVINQVNQDMQTIFFPGQGTTFEDRLEASARIGALSVGTAAVAIAAAPIAGQALTAVAEAVGAAATKLTWTAVAACARNVICWSVIGAGGGQVAARASDQQIKVVEQHLRQFGENKPEQMMIERLKSGQWTEWEQRFLHHELIEAGLMRQGITEPRAAHLAALEVQHIPYVAGYEAYLFHPDVVKALPDYFSSAAQRLAEILGNPR
jgi:RHS repeat-associated protein